jgi:hypothetical protein
MSNDAAILDNAHPGGCALDCRQLPRDLRGIFTIDHRAHAGGRSETVDLCHRIDPSSPSRSGVFGTSNGNTIGYPFNVGVRPNSSDANSQPVGDFSSTKP